ncbi:MAG: M20/M25/M40 family metallo-hydrolase [Bacteroidota bacterium]|jgi:acetylornithine deacetylase
MSIYTQALELLKQLIAIESFSKSEHITAELLLHSLHEHGIASDIYLNNVYSCNRHFDRALPTLLLNSHHDTVKPVNGWTTNPFEPLIIDNRLIGLGSNDAGASLVCLWAAFIELYEEHLPFNIILALTAEEEILGNDGIEALLPKLGTIDAGIVGEPTAMHMAIAEKGLLVLDCFSYGIAGHAARNIGKNAIYSAMKDIEWFATYTFPKISDTLGEVKMTVTQIESGQQHNVIPDICSFVVDIRITDCYSHQDILSIIQQNVSCEIKPRSLRLGPSTLPHNHPFYHTALTLGISTFGSPTMSDQALMNFPTIKMGPGLSERSHTANEFIYLDEIKQGIDGYISFIRNIKGLSKSNIFTII